MLDLDSNLPWLTLAQSTAPAGDAPPPSGSTSNQPVTTQGGGGGNQGLPPNQPRGGIFDNLGMLLPFLLIGVFLFILMGGNRREKKKRQAILESLKKGDKVLTIGGEFGTVVEVRDTDVVLKVDENSNTRIRYSRSAIQSVLSDAKEPAKD